MSGQPVESSQANFHGPQSHVSVDWATVSTAQERPGVNVAVKEMYHAGNVPAISVARGIADLFRETYGDKYPDARFLDPLQVCDVIRKGEYIFAALFDEHGEVLGIGGISKFEYLGANVDSYGTVCELCKLIVAERARGARLTAPLTAMRIEYAREMGYASVVSLPFSSHDKSQKSLDKEGFRPSGISVCDWDDVFAIGQRESAIFMHKILDQEIQQLRTVYIPESLRHVVEIGYQSLECARQFASEVAFTATGKQPEIRVDYASGGLQAFLHCPTGVSEMLQALEDPGYQGLHHLSVSLDAGNPLALRAIEKLLEEGFRFSGVHPLGKTDLITLQRVSDLPATPMASMQLHHEATIRILNKILA